MASSVENQEEASSTIDYTNYQLDSNDENNINLKSDSKNSSISFVNEQPNLQDGPSMSTLMDNAVKVTSSPVEEKNTTLNNKNDSVYQIKWISRNGCKSPIITQNENGPCPLIAITNVLIMKGRITVPLLSDFVTTENLMAYLGDCLLESIPKNVPEGTQLNFEQNMHDAMAVLPKLQTGLDVNVRFTGIHDFEYTPECIIFDLLRIPLYHGWLMDPQMHDVLSAVGKCSYNQLVEKIINSKSSTDELKMTEALVAEGFLEKTASQLTYHGLCELTSRLQEEELCVLFRNNHFSSLIKHNNCLYQLVTDQGFVNENVVWETLNNIDGDGQFVDAAFVLVPPKQPTPQVVGEKQIDQDYLVALSLQEEQEKHQNTEQAWEDFKQKKLGIAADLTDEELARRLQEEEMKQQTDNQPPVTPPPQRNNNNNRNRDCLIL